MASSTTDMDVAEQLRAGSTTGYAEPTHAVQIYPDPKISTTTTRCNWLNHLEKQQEEERPKPMQGKIHRVPDLLRATLKPGCSYYQPKVVSLGPYHFGRAKLRKFQELKRSIADRLVPDKNLEDSLRSEIKKNMGNLRGAYSSQKMKIAGPSKWEEMFFLDGCFVLHFIFCTMYNRVEDLKIKRYDMDSVHNDLFLAENQLPYELLRILSGNDPKLLDLIDDYIYAHRISSEVDRVWRQDEPVHLLDRLRTMIIGTKSETHNWQQGMCGSWKRQSKSQPGRKRTVLRHAKELTARGIHLKPNRTGLLKDIFFRPHFIYGILKLPRIIVDDSTGLLFSNLAAYEMCADVDSTITSYVCFLASLANHADDIKELQSTGVLINHLASEEMAANLFNEMSQGLHPDEDAYMDVKKKINKFFEHKTEASIALWVAESYHNHFKSPLTAMAFLAACLVLGLTVIQTYFTIYPRAINN